MKEEFVPFPIPSLPPSLLPLDSIDWAKPCSWLKVNNTRSHQFTYPVHAATVFQLSSPWSHWTPRLLPSFWMYLLPNIYTLNSKSWPKTRWKSLRSLTCISKLLQFQLLAHSRARNHPCLPLWCKILQASRSGSWIATFDLGLSFTVGTECCLPERVKHFSPFFLQEPTVWLRNFKVPTARKVIDNFIP